MHPQISSAPADTVTPVSVAVESEDVITLLDDLLTALADIQADGIVILGPGVTDVEGAREVLICHSHARQELTEVASSLLASSPDFLSSDWPLMAWQHLASADPSVHWRSLLASAGLSSLVRVAIELPGQRWFEIYTFTELPVTTRVEAAVVAWACMAMWPRIRRALAARRLRLSPREIQCLWHVCAGLSAKEICKKMDVTERTASYFITQLAAKFGTTGRAALPQRAAWLGLFDAPLLYSARTKNESPP